MSSKLGLTGGLAVGAMALLAFSDAHAQTSRPTIQQLEDQIQGLQQTYQSQIQNLQQQVDQLKTRQQLQAEEAANARMQAAAAQAAVKQASSGGLGSTYHINGVTLKVGGFIESAGIYRSGNQTADVGSNFGSGIPFSGNPNDHTSEFRMSARQSRPSLLATGEPDPVTKLTAYFETDFLGAAPTANSNESNSYNLRLRQGFAEYDRKDLGFSLVGGQAWSLATLETSGLYPRKEAVPLTIDAQYNVGFNWMRAPQMRFIENFAPGWWAALSLENPAALVYGGANSVKGVLTSNPGTGGGLLNNGGSTFCSYNGTSCGEGYTGTGFTLDVMPDVIVKLAAEPGWGHYELYGLAREFRTETTSSFSGAPGIVGGTHPTTFGGGIGAGAVLPVLPKMVDVTFNVLAGEGVGKYASGQLPDFTINPNTGAPAAVPEIEGMVGIIGHPAPSLDLYSYFGVEQADSKAYDFGGKPYGYGNGGYTNGVGSNGGTGTAFSSPATCVVGNEGTTTIDNVSDYGTAGAGCNINRLWQAQLGGWWKFYQGDFGLMELGASYSYVHVGTFSGVGGLSPHTSDNIVMTSFRYYPF